MRSRAPTNPGNQLSAIWADTEVHMATLWLLALIKALELAQLIVKLLM